VAGAKNGSYEVGLEVDVRAAQGKSLIGDGCMTTSMMTSKTKPALTATARAA
jgi:hypothetical protein